ncbi:hypothetical protein DFJ74DRAFT_162585 [Hyaloraphidium curvatum]|nr:hypothetical protein DFJ74DRAFT_162585 [Hyaloraphidium curvatum]
MLNGKATGRFSSETLTSAIEIVVDLRNLRLVPDVIDSSRQPKPGSPTGSTTTARATQLADPSPEPASGSSTKPAGAASTSSAESPSAPTPLAKGQAVPPKEAQPRVAAPTCCAGTHCHKRSLILLEGMQTVKCVSCDGRMHYECGVPNMDDKDGVHTMDYSDNWRCSNCVDWMGDLLERVLGETRETDDWAKKRYTKIKQDLWHALHRLRIKRNHPFALELFRRLRDAILLYHKGIWEEVDAVTQKKLGVPLQLLLRANPRWVNAECRALLRRRQSWCGTFSSSGRNSGRTIGPAHRGGASDAAGARGLRTPYPAGCDRLPLGQSRCTAVPGDGARPTDFLMRYRCFCGTNFTEGGRHRKKNQRESSWNMGIMFADLLDLESTFIHNIEASIRTVEGFKDVGHRAYYLLDLTNALSEDVCGVTPFPWYSGCRAFGDTGEVFGI